MKWHPFKEFCRDDKNINDFNFSVLYYRFLWGNMAIKTNEMVDIKCDTLFESLYYILNVHAVKKYIYLMDISRLFQGENSKNMQH